MCAPRVPCARSPVGSSPARCLRRRRLIPSRLPARMLPTLYVLSSTRQGASVFNQPLTFDTSSVTNMSDMFRVRSGVPCPRSPQLGPPLHVACAAAAASYPLPHPSPHAAHFVCPLFHSAGRVGVQPAADFRHVQRHKHERHVSGAFRRALPPISTVGSSPARCLRRCRPTPSCLPARMPLASYVLLLTRQNARAFNQPLSLDTSKATDMTAMFYVRSARALRLIPTRVFVCTLHAPPPPHTHPTPSPHAAHYVCPLFHSAGCVGVQPAAEF